MVYSNSSELALALQKCGQSTVPTVHTADRKSKMLEGAPRASLPAGHTPGFTEAQRLPLLHHTAKHKLRSSPWLPSQEVARPT